MIRAALATHASTQLLAVNTLVVPAPPSNTAASTPTGTLPLSVSGVAVTAAVSPLSVQNAAGQGAYSAGAPFPMSRGTSNSMSGAVDVLGPAGATVSTLGVAGNYGASSVAVDADGSVYAVDQSGGAATLRKFNAAWVQQWAYVTTNIPFSGTFQYAFNVTLGSNSVVYFVTSAGLHSVDAATGVLNWLNPLREINYLALAPPVLDAVGNVYCATGSTIFSVTPAGAVRWTSFLPMGVNSMSLDADTGILYVAAFSWDNSFEVGQVLLVLVNHETGAQLVTPSGSNTVYTTGAVIGQRNVPPMIGATYVYVLTGRMIVAFTKAGGIAWSVPVYLNRQNALVGVAYNPRLDRLYVTGMQSGSSLSPQRVALTALDGTTGLRLADSTVTLTNNALVVQPVIDAANNVYAYDSAGRFLVFDAELNQLASVSRAVGFGGAPPLALTGSSTLVAATTTGLWVLS